MPPRPPEHPTNSNLYALFASRFPSDKSCVFLEHDRGETSFGDMEQCSARLSAVLKSCGVIKGDRVVVQVAKSPESVLLYLACLRLGAVFIPLNTAYTASEVDYFVTDSQPRVVICDPANETEISQICATLTGATILTLDGEGNGRLIEQARLAMADHTVTDSKPDDLAAILYTSGTTGRSKGAMLTHENLSSNALVLHQYWGWEPGDVLLHALPIFHVHGLFVALHCALLNRSRVLFHSGFDVGRVIADLPKSTVMMGVPSFYTRLLQNEGFGRETCRNMRLFLSGSAPLLADTFTEFEQRTGHTLLERYGMTEAGMITSNPYDGDRIAGTVGFALPTVSARIAGKDGRVLEQNDIGVLEITGPNVFAGYWNMPEKTAEEFRADGFFITSDMATMDETGRISIVGRAKDLVITGGYNVYPKEVELAIDALEGITESAVIGVPHPDFGEAVTAIVVPEANSSVTAQDISAQLTGVLAKFKQPKTIVFVVELPRNTMGKVQKKALREAYADICTTDHVQRLV